MQGRTKQLFGLAGQRAAAAEQPREHRSTGAMAARSSQASAGQRGGGGVAQFEMESASNCKLCLWLWLWLWVWPVSWCGYGNGCSMGISGGFDCLAERASERCADQPTKWMEKCRCLSRRSVRRAQSETDRAKKQIRMPLQRETVHYSTAHKKRAFAMASE